MLRRFKAAALAAVVCCSTGGLIGCSMITSYPTAGFLESPVQIQTGGSYFLAKHVLVVTVTGPANAARVNVGIKAIADRRQLLDTGLKLSAFSDDDIKIDVGNDGLLLKITSIADDKTAAVIVNITKAIYSPLLRLGATEATPPILFEGEFDPFNWHEAADINDFLVRQFKSCIEVEVAPGRWSPGCPSRLAQAKFQDTSPAEIAELIVPSPGIYYRRPIHHRVRIVERGQTRSLSSHAFANAAPLLRIDVDRTTFVRRQTTVDFNAGAPTSVHVVKPSEAVEVSKLPLSIATAIIDAPIEGLAKRKTLVEAETAQLTAQTNKLKAETEYLDLVKKRVAEGTVVPTADGLRLASPGETGFRMAPLSTGVTPEFRARCLQLRLQDAECFAQYQALRQ